MGKDLVIGDPCSNIPVGLLPDFVHKAHDRSSEEFISRALALYDSLKPHITPGGVRFPLFQCIALNGIGSSCSWGPPFFVLVSCGLFSSFLLQGEWAQVIKLR